MLTRRATTLLPILSRWLPWLVFAIALAITYQLWNGEEEHATRALKTDFDFRSRETAGRIEQRMFAYEQQLRGVQGLFASTGIVGREEFNRYIDTLDLDENYPGIQGVGFSLVIPPEQKDKVIATIRKEGFPEYNIWPAGSRDVYTSIIYIAPFAGRNIRPFGYDMFTESTRRSAMERSRDNGAAALSGPIKLVAESNEKAQVGFKIYMPVYRNGVPHDNLKDRRNHLVGWVYGLFRTGDLMEGILGKGIADIEIEIFDGGKASGSTIMYDTGKPLYAESKLNSLFQSVHTLHIAGHEWTVVINSLPAFEAQLDQSKARFIAVAGIAASLMLFLAWLLVQGRARALQASREIGDELTTLKKAEERIKRLSQIHQALSETNQAIVRMKRQEELFPLVCRCAVEFGGMNMAWIGQLDKKSERIVPVASHGIGQEYLDGLVISSRGSLPEGQGPTGTALREYRPVIVNDFANDPNTAPWQGRAAKYGWGSTIAFPIQRGDEPFAVLTVYHQKTNAFDEESAELLDEMTSNVSFALDNFDHEVRRQLAEESLLLAASVYEVSSEAMMVTDANGRILSINPAFTKITGYSQEEIVGKNPKFLYAGIHDKAIYETMQREVIASGHWHGELWNKHKNGKDCLELLTVSTIYNEDGSVSRQVTLFSDITQRKQSEELIWKQANFDSLTGLPNRQMFFDRLTQETKKAQRSGKSLAVLFIDLDQFKVVNDTLGHGIGDDLLKETTQRLMGCVRATDTVARLGGDEFTIILSNLDDPTSVELVTNRILQRLAEPFQLEEHIAYVSASIGITFYPDDATDVEILLKNADQAMYAAKDQGRGRFHYFTASMQEAAQIRMSLTNDLRDALNNNEFLLHYQPIVELATGVIHKAEALIRWQHPTRGLVPPNDFIPLAEDTGMIVEIGNWVFTEAAKKVKEWRTTYHPSFQISVNKSPVQFHNASSTHTDWIKHLRQMDLPGQSIAIEITEGLLLDTKNNANNQLIEFRDAGIQISIDDFGTGYSSLSYLKNFAIDYVKIDQSFTRNLKPESSDMALCEAIIVMAHKLGMKVIAEGVETTEQSDLLISIGCDFAQGYLFSKPLIAADFERMLENLGVYTFKKIKR